jgi:hypothetical protein
MLLHTAVLNTTHMTLTAAGTAAYCVHTCYRAPLSAEFIPSLTIKASDLLQDGASLAPQVLHVIHYCSYHPVLLNDLHIPLHAC